jgi:GDP-L-fucose synthase
MMQNNIIHNAYKNNVRKLLFLGSTCIYPREAPQPMKEDCLLTSPLEYTNEPYAIAKIAGMKMCEAYNFQYGTNYISVMPTNLYGPNDNFNLETSHVLPAMVRKIYLAKCLEDSNWNAIKEDLKVRPIEGINENNTEDEIIQILNKYGIVQSANQSNVSLALWGTGQPLREFLWSEDMADACVFLMENIDFKDVNPCNNTKSLNSVPCEVRNTHINIGTGSDISIADLAQLIKKVVGYNHYIFLLRKSCSKCRAFRV